MNTGKTIALTLIFGALLIASSCNRKLSSKVSNVVLDQYIQVDDTNCKETHIPRTNGIYAEIKCDHIAFKSFLDEKVLSNEPSLSSSFRQSFTAVHYANFLRRLGIQERLYDVMRSRVQPMDAIPMAAFEGELMFDCSTCNAVGTVIFDTDRFFYPYVESNDLLKAAQNKQYDYNTIDGYIYSYMHIPELSELLIKPSDSRSKEYQVLISLTDNPEESSQAFQQLKKIKRISKSISTTQ